MFECLHEQNLKACVCTYAGCLRAGFCCQCVRYHREKGEIPGCFFSEEGEKTFDRSMENFIADHQARKK